MNFLKCAYKWLKQKYLCSHNEIIGLQTENGYFDIIKHKCANCDLRLVERDYEVHKNGDIATIEEKLRRNITSPNLLFYRLQNEKIPEHKCSCERCK